MKSKTCALPPLSSVGDSYLKCYLSKMSSSTEYYIRHSVLPDPLSSFSRDSPEFFSAVRLAASAADCVNPSSALDISKRSRYVWEADSIQCMRDALRLNNASKVTDEMVLELCPPQFCLGFLYDFICFILIHFDSDTTCLMPGDQCYALCATSFEFEPSSEANCSESTCPLENANCNNQDVCAYCNDGNPNSFHLLTMT